MHFMQRTHKELYHIDSSQGLPGVLPHHHMVS